MNRNFKLYGQTEYPTLTVEEKKKTHESYFRISELWVQKLT